MTKFLKPFVKRNVAREFKKDTGGNVGMMLAVMLFAIIGGLAVAIDLSNAYSARQRLQNTTDAVALLAVKDGIEDRSELQAVAQAYFNQAYPNVTGERIEIVNISRDGDRVDIQTRNNIDTFFAQIFGRNDLDVSVKSSSIFAQQALDVSLVLDTTGSMGDPATGGGTKLESLQASATRLMDTFEGFDNDNLRVSIVPFGQYVNVGSDQRNAPWIENNRSRAGDALCVGSQAQPRNTRVDVGASRIPLATGATCGTALQPLTNDFNALKSTISNLEARGFTYAPSGLMWGWRTLDARAPLTEAASSTRGQKVLVLMTDGANTRSIQGETHEGRNRRVANRTTADICESVKGSDITVYTIAFEVSDANTRRLLRDCASGTENFFNAQNSAQLDQAFTNISSTLNELRITS